MLASSADSLEPVMPSTLTTAAIPTATASPDKAAGGLRVRSPMVAVGSQSAPRSRACSGRPSVTGRPSVAGRPVTGWSSVMSVHLGLGMVAGLVGYHSPIVDLAH